MQLNNLIVLCLSAIISTQSSAQSEEPQQIAQYPGAPYEDRNGNLWFGSVLKGLFLFDGEEFINFTTEDGLGSNTTRGGVLEAEDGTLYFATTGGLTKYDGESFVTLTEYEPIKITRGYSKHGNHRDLWDAHIDQNDTLWIATMDGVFRHDGEEFKRFEMPKIADENEALFHPRMIDCIFEDTNGDLWFGTDGAGAFRYDGETFTNYTVESHNLASNNITTIIRDRRGDYWFGTANGGISKYDGNTFTTHLRSKEHSIHSGWGRYFSILEDRQGNIWFGAAFAGGGVYRYDGESFTYLSEEHGLGNGGVPSIRMDRSGNLWFGTTTGVYRYANERFINFTRDNPDTGVGTTQNKDLLNDWLSETIEFPPGFAPDLPTGKEDLRFPPGWRTPDSEEFWSYAILMRIDEPVPGAKRIEALLDLYYDGLMSAFSVGQDSDEPIDPAQVKVTKIRENHYEAAMHIIDGFATFKPIDIRIKLVTESESDNRSIIKLRASPQPDGHRIWAALQAGIEDIEQAE